MLVWSPRLSPGGGFRLLWSLVPRLARQDGIRSVRWVVPAGALDAPALARARGAGLAMIELAGKHRGGRAHAELLVSNGRTLAVAGNDAWRDATARELSAGCDVFFCPWPHSDPPPDVDVPIVCTYQDTTLIDYPEGTEASLARSERQIGAAWLRASAATVVTSQATALNLDRLYGELASGLHVIRQTVRPDSPDSVQPLAGGAPPAGLPERYLVFAGNIAVHKNLDLLLTAWSRFEDREHWPLVLCGYGTDAVLQMPLAADWRSSQLHGLATRLGLGPASGLHALGYIDDNEVLPLIAGAAALIMPSFTEGGGSFPVEEAMQAGVPVLCADIPVMREHVGERSADVGWFDPASVDSIGRALREFVADHPARKASAMAGRADRRPTWDDVASQYAAVLAGATG